MQTLKGRALLAGLFLAAAPLGAAAQGLPGGAAAITETHGEWMVHCISMETAPRCSLSHRQLSDDAQRTRIIAVELAGVDEAGAVSGVLVLPFGLKLDDGAAIAVDEHAPYGVRFSTCLPLGCLMPLRLDPAMVATMRQGAALSVVATIEEGGEQAIFIIPLAGLTSALDRLSQLGS